MPINRVFKSITIFIFVGFLFSGCVIAPVIVAGAAGAGATYSLTTDSVIDTLPHSKEKLVETFVEIIRESKGKILFVSISEGKVKAEFGKKRAYLDVQSDGENTSKVKIRVRKGFQMLPDKEGSLKLYKTLLNRLK